MEWFNLIKKQVFLYNLKMISEVRSADHDNAAPSPDILRNSSVNRCSASAIQNFLEKMNLHIQVGEEKGTQVSDSKRSLVSCVNFEMRRK